MILVMMTMALTMIETTATATETRTTMIVVNVYFMMMCGGTVVYWLVHWTSDLEVGGSSLVSAVVLFP